MLRKALICLSLLAPLTAGAETLTGAAAAKLLFPATGVAVDLTGAGGLADKDAQMLAMVAGGQPYYGAIAISPDEGLMVVATVAAVNHHSTEAAEAAALKGCEAQRKGKADCAVVALIRPEGFEPRALTLSSDASKAVAEHYKEPGALAISPETGLFALAAGAGAGDAAVAACNEKAGAGDCVVAFAD